MLKIKITGSSGTERQMMQRCISKFLRHNNQRVIESEKGEAGVRQIITSAGPEVAMTENIVLVECDNITSICQLDQRIVARATGEGESSIASEKRQWFVTVKKRGCAPQNRIVSAADPDKAVRVLGDPGSFESITVRPS